MRITWIKTEFSNIVEHLELDNEYVANKLQRSEVRKQQLEDGIRGREQDLKKKKETLAKAGYLLRHHQKSGQILEQMCQAYVEVLEQNFKGDAEEEDTEKVFERGDTEELQEDAGEESGSHVGPGAEDAKAEDSSYDAYSYTEGSESDGEEEGAAA